MSNVVFMTIRWLVVVCTVAALAPVRAVDVSAERRISAGDRFSAGGKIDLREALPGIGGVIAFVVVLMGLGARTLSLYNRYHSAPAA